MSLTQILYSMPATRLREIVRARASTLHGLPRVNDKRELARALASALSHYHSVQRVLKETSLPQFFVLRSLVVRGGEVHFSTLAAEVDAADVPRLEQAVSELETLGLAYRWSKEGERAVFVPRSVAQHVPLPGPLRLRLEVALASLPSVNLGRICAALGLRPASKNKTSLAGEIQEALRVPGRVHQQAEMLSPEGQRILEFLITEGGEASLQQLAQEVDSRRRRQVLDLTWSPYRADHDPRNGVEELLARALAVMDQVGGWGSGRVVVPIEVLEALTQSRGRGILPPEPEWERMSADSKPLQKHESLLRDVAYLFGFVTRTEASRTNAGVMYKTALRSLARGMTVPDQAYAEFVYALAVDGGLIASGGRKNLFGVTRRGRAWLELKPEAQRKSLFETWRASGSWSESQSNMLDDGRGYRYGGEDRELRSGVLQLLAESTGGEQREPVSAISVSEHARYRWWARFPRESGSGDGEVSSLRLVRRIAGMSLYWLGVTEAAFDLEGSATSLRLSEHAACWLSRSDAADSAAPCPPPQELPDKFILQPNLDIFAPPNMPASVLYRLFTIAEPSGVGMARLTRESLRQALDAGEDYDSLVTFLRERSHTGVPQNVEYLLREVGGRHGHIEVGHAGLYLKVDDPALLKELQAQKNLKISFRRSLADNIALVTGDSVDGILKLLRQAGYFPVSHEEKSAPKPAPRIGRRLKDEDLDEIFAESPSYSTVGEIESRIDWDAVAAEDGMPYREEPEPAKAAARGTASSYIEELVWKAMEESRCLEIVYKPADGGSLTQRVIEPAEMAGPLVYAYCRLRQDWRNFNLRNIQSARLTGEDFEERQ